MTFLVTHHWFITMVILHGRQPSSEPFQVFVVVLIQIRRMRANSPAGSRSGLVQELKGMASLTLLLGLTWTFGFFTWGPARVFLLYLFSGLNSLQGQRKPTLPVSWYQLVICHYTPVRLYLCPRAFHLPFPLPDEGERQETVEGSPLLRALPAGRELWCDSHTRELSR